jgi:hypothetical protein
MGRACRLAGPYGTEQPAKLAQRITSRLLDRAQGARA